MSHIDGSINMEAYAWRKLSPEIALQLERVLASQGDRPDPELLKLQHRVAELRSLKPGDRMPAWIRYFD